MPATSEALIVLTTCGDAATAQHLARTVVTARLAACVTILAAASSVYRWRGEVETASESVLLMKSTRSAYPGLEQLLRAEHPYELPEIVAVPIVTGLPAYLDWISDQVDACA
ncbi:MAG: divalent-cation tolerance protein CutA [Gammaproteobacteria bacterium]|nr:divalent-cation tolerance protein CutA [Gammaproteobacteria bacterium]